MVLVVATLAGIDLIGSATGTIGDGSVVSIGRMLTGVEITGFTVAVTAASIASKSSRSPLRQLSINASFVCSTGFVLFVPIDVFAVFFGLTYDIFGSSSSSSSVFRLFRTDSGLLAIGT